MTLLYVVGIDKVDEDGEFREHHYFKSSWEATKFAMNNGIENFTSDFFDDKLANEIAED